MVDWHLYQISSLVKYQRKQKHCQLHYEGRRDMERTTSDLLELITDPTDNCLGSLVMSVSM